MTGPGVQNADDARAWRWSDDRAAVTRELVTAAITSIRRHGPNVTLHQLAQWAEVDPAVLTRHFPTLTELLAEIRDRVVARVVEDAATQPDQSVRALIPENVAAALLRVALQDPNMWRATVDVGLVDAALKRVTIVATTFRTFYRLSIWEDSLYRRAAIAAVIRATIDEACRQSADEACRVVDQDVEGIVTAFIDGLYRATA